MNDNNEKKIPLRSEVPAEYTWDLTDIFKSDEEWLAEYESLKDISGEVAAFAGKISQSREELLKYLKMGDDIALRIELLFGYASRKGDEDTGNSFYQDMRGKAMSVYVAVASAAAFADPEIMSIPDETLDKWYSESEELCVYRRSLYRIRRRREHILSPECEMLLASAGEMAQSAENIYGIFHNADLRFPAVKDGEGKERQLTDGTFVPLLESPDRVLRENAFKAYYARLGEYRNTLATTLDSQFKQLRFYAGARKYGSTLEAALDETEVPVAVYHNLIEAVHSNLDKMYRYVALRKKILGVDELHMYDVYTPIVAEAAEEYSYEKSKATVLDSLKVLGEDYLDILREGFDNRWIDVYENVGKRGGAYSSMGIPHPYVLLNHHDNLDSMFTLAHEMGHSIHSYLSCKHQPPCNMQYVIFVAEVASTCNEVLVMRDLLSKTTDKKKRAYLINHFLDQFKGTVYRQTMFAEFEYIIGKMAENGEALTADALCAKYHELNRLYFGPDMVSDDEIALEWARIPHFYYDYYV
ncbi:MAG: oligoendopeptidase F, partial [Clostridia bacterium]|nr:oligoendopeptidase F [Clostridia bacterium]